jgi:ABC-type amino acid transport substrate-binding protein
MAIRSIRPLVSLCVFAIYALAGPVQADQPQLNFAVALSPPHITVEQNGDIDLIVKETFRRVGVTIAYQPTSVSRGLYGTLTGEFDGFFATPILTAPMLKPLVRVEEPIFSSIAGGVFLRDDITIYELADFKKYRVGYGKGWKQPGILLKDVPETHTANSPELLMEMLAQNRIDVAFMYFTHARYIADKKKITGLKFSKFIDYSGLFIHLNPKHADLAADLAQALRDMRADGTYMDLLSRADLSTKQGLSE